jgi:hypothetical protein
MIKYKIVSSSRTTLDMSHYKTIGSGLSLNDESCVQFRLSLAANAPPVLLGGGDME